MARMTVTITLPTEVHDALRELALTAGAPSVAGMCAGILQRELLNRALNLELSREATLEPGDAHHAG